MERVGGPEEARRNVLWGVLPPLRALGGKVVIASTRSNLVRRLTLTRDGIKGEHRSGMCKVKR